MNNISFTDYLSENLPLKLSLDIIKESVLCPVDDFIGVYFKESVKCMLIWNDALFMDCNLKIILPASYRSQVIGLIALCRYPLRLEFVEGLTDSPPEYSNNFLHCCLFSARLKERNIPTYFLYTIDFLNNILPYPISKGDLSSNCFETVVKTSRLNEKYFTDEVLKTFGLSADAYKNLRIFEDSERLRIIGLIKYFQIPLKRKVLKINPIILPKIA